MHKAKAENQKRGAAQLENEGALAALSPLAWPQGASSRPHAPQALSAPTPAVQDTHPLCPRPRPGASGRRKLSAALGVPPPAAAAAAHAGPKHSFPIPSWAGGLPPGHVGWRAVGALFFHEGLDGTSSVGDNLGASLHLSVRRTCHCVWRFSTRG